MIRQVLFLALLSMTWAVQAEEAATSATMKKENAVNYEQGMFSKGKVARSAITSAVQQREPIDQLDKITTQQNQLYFFTELRDMSGQTAKHRWEYNGKVMAEVDFNVKGPRWRVWSSKKRNPGWTGDWKVSVINAVGDVVSEQTFSYEAAIN